MKSAASKRLRELADEYDANEATYGRQMALDVLVSELEMALNEVVAIAHEGPSEGARFGA